jgi:hypothetical protein
MYCCELSNGEVRWKMKLPILINLDFIKIYELKYQLNQDNNYFYILMMKEKIVIYFRKSDGKLKIIFNFMKFLFIDDEINIENNEEKEENKEKNEKIIKNIKKEMKNNYKKEEYIFSHLLSNKKIIILQIKNFLNSYQFIFLKKSNFELFNILKLENVVFSNSSLFFTPDYEIFSFNFDNILIESRDSSSSHTFWIKIYDYCSLDLLFSYQIKSTLSFSFDYLCLFNNHRFYFFNG